MRKIIALNTEEFWEKMGGMAFIRLDLYHGASRNEVYVTLLPPEHVPGFVTDKIVKLGLLLGIE